MKFRSAAVKFLLPFLAFVSVAQETPAPDQESPVTTLHANTRLVVLDVIVTDKQGAPVRNLSQADFTVLEDGKEQPIASFEPPGQHAPVVLDDSGKMASSHEGNSKNVVANPLTILVFDSLDTNILDQAYARTEINKYLEAHGPTLAQPTALMALEEKRLELLHDYTSDAKTLEDSLKTHRAHLPFRLLRSMGENNKYALADPHDSAERLLDAIEALREIATANEQFAGRKNVIWIGPGFPSLNQLRVWAGFGFRGLNQFNASPTKKVTLQSWEQETLELLWKSRISVYTIDPRGTGGAEEQMAPPTGDLAFEQIAPLTGGRIIRDTNDIDTRIATSVADGGAYYGIAYHPLNQDWNGKFRNIKVVMRDSTLTARTRDGYYGIPDSSPTMQDMDRLLSRAVMNPLPYHSLEVQASASLTDSQPRTAKIKVDIDTNELHWETPESGKRRCELTVVTAGFSLKGQVVAHVVKELEVVVDDKKFAELKKEGMVMNLAMALPPNAVRMRVVARDSTNGNMGTADLTPSGEQFH
jgi:VWFA-related protein